MIYIKTINFLFSLLLSLSFLTVTGAAQSTHKIEVLVNDSIITNYDIAQHFAINAILENINVTNENGDFLYNKTVNDLINMKLQQIKIDEYNVKIDEEDSDYYENYFFQSKKLDRNKVYKIIRENNIDLDLLKEKIFTIIAWEQLTSGLFLHTISISDTEIDELLKNDNSLSPDLARKILKNKQVQLKANKYLGDLRTEANIERR